MMQMLSNVKIVSNLKLQILMGFFLPAAAGFDKVELETVVVDAPFEMPEIHIPIFPNSDFAITDFGAESDSLVKTTSAIAAAIDACHEAGGGRVVIPEGEWLTGAVHLKSNVNFHISEGAVLRFSGDPSDYLPAVHSTWEGWECYNYSPLIAKM